MNISVVKGWWATLLASRFVRSTLGLSGATAVAQLVALAAYPILTRLYSPDAFGILAVFTSVALLAVPLLTLRLDYAVPLPDEERHGAQLASLSALFAVALFAGMGLAFLVAGRQLPDQFELERLHGVELWVGLAGLLLSFTAILTAWNIRRQSFRFISAGRIVLVAVTVVVQSLWAFLGGGPEGLLIGFCLGVAAEALVLLIASRPSLLPAVKAVRIAETAAVLRTHRAFVLLTCPSNFINSLGLLAPPIVIVSLFGAAEGGAFFLAQRIVSQPARLLGQAVCNVFWGHAAELYRRDPVGLMKLFSRSNTALLGIMSPGLLLPVVGAPLFVFLFGAEWSDAGLYAGIMFIGEFLFLAANGTGCLTVYGLNHWQSAYDVTRVALVSAVLVATWLMSLDILTCVVLLTATRLVAGATLLFLNYLALRRAVARHANAA